MISVFSSSSCSFLAASFRLLKQNSTRARTAPNNKSIPIASPAFPPVLSPPDDFSAVADEAELAADKVDDPVDEGDWV